MFGVQSVADAIDRLTRSPGDLQTVTVGNDYQIRFTVGLQSPRRGSAYTTYAQTPAANVNLDVDAKRNKTTYYEDDYDPSADPVTGARGYQSETQIYYDVAHDYEQESIAIVVTGGSSIKKVGSYDVPTAESTSLTMFESTNNSYSTTSNPHQRLSGSVTLTLTAPASTPTAVTEITITPTTDATGHVNPSPLVFTVYAVGPLNSAGTTAINATNAPNGVQRVSDQSDTQINEHFTFTPGDHQSVNYSVEGNGRLYVSLGSDRKTSPTNSLFTSSSAPVFLATNAGSSKVTAHIAGSSNAATVLYIFSGARLNELPQIEIISGDNQTGVPNSRLINPLGVRFKDGKGRAISGLPVTFTPAGGATLQPVIGTDVYLTNPPTVNTWASAFATTLQIRQATATVPAAITADTAALVPTDRSGEAKVYLEVGAVGDKTVTVSAGGETKTFFATSATNTDIPSLEIFSGNNQRSDSNGRVANLLIVRVLASNNQPLPTQLVTFTTTKGFLTTPSEYQDSTSNPATINGPATQVTARTDINGKAGVSYDLVNHSGAADVIAEISSTTTPVYQRRVTFNINGTGASTPTTRNPYLSISPSSLTGSAGEQGSFTVLAYDSNNRQQTGVRVNLSSSGVSVPSTVNSGESVSITLPSSSTSISASAAGYTSRSLSVNVQAVPDEIVKVSGDSPVQTGEPGAQLSSAFVVRVEDSSNNPIPQQTVTFRVTAGGGNLGGVSSATATTNSSGEASTTLTLGSAAGTNTVEASVSGVSSVVTFTATAERVSVANRLEIEDGNNQTGELNRLLPSPLIVQLLNQDGDPIQGLTIEFEVIQGTGRLSPRTARTDSSGFAETNFTPTSTGNIQVRASLRGIDTISPVTFNISGGLPPDAIVMVSGNNQSGSPGQALANPFVVEVVDEDDEPVSGVSVTFAVTAGGGSVSSASATTNNNGRAQTTLTLGDTVGDNTVTARVSGVSRAASFTARAGAQVLVRAAQRPPLYWIDRANGTLHRLVGEETEALASNMKGATSLTVDAANGYIYWTAQTGQNKGAIRRASLNGRGAQTLKSVSSLPMGIAVDGAGGMVYWTNDRGNILSMPIAGGKVTNVARNLSNPGPIALSNGVLYWGEATGSVRKMSLTAKPKKIENLVTGLSEPLAIAIAKGKVYWIERGGGNGGRLQRANLNGNGIEQLKGFSGGVPIGFTIDSSANRIYWTKSAGKIQRSNLAGKFVKDIVTGLPNPGSIAIGTAVADDAPVVRQPSPDPTPTPTPTPDPTPDNAKYDVNGDGTVNQDDVDQVVLAVAFKSGDMKYDLNGDGVVDAKDITAVVGAVSSAGAAAPSLLTDVDVTRLDVTVLHEQIAVLLASGDRSLAAKQTLAYLQQLLTLARPDETVLLTNFPNPFNPETWIPYHLAESTDVRVNIYDAQGVLVRVLTVGHQTAGYYTSRSRAAYWDGRNAFGERVASGIYFYQLQTDEMSPLRKMVILK